jgi:hypothetical protein
MDAHRDANGYGNSDVDFYAFADAHAYADSHGNTHGAAYMDSGNDVYADDYSYFATYDADGYRMEIPERWRGRLDVAIGSVRCRLRLRSWHRGEPILLQFQF